MPSQVRSRVAPDSTVPAAPRHARATGGARSIGSARRPRLGWSGLLVACYLLSGCIGGIGCQPHNGASASMGVQGPERVEVGETVLLKAGGECFGTSDPKDRFHPRVESVIGPDGAAVPFQLDESGPLTEPTPVTFVAGQAGQYAVQFICNGVAGFDGGQDGADDHKLVHVLAVSNAPPQISAGPWLEAWRPGQPLRYDGATVHSPRHQTGLSWTAAGCPALSLGDETALRPVLTASGPVACDHVDLTLQATSSTGRIASDTTRLHFQAGLAGPTAALTLDGERFEAYQVVTGSLAATSQARLTRYAVTLVDPDGGQRLLLGAAGTGAAAVEEVLRPLRFQLGKAGTYRLDTELVTAHGTLATSRAVVAETSTPGFVIAPSHLTTSGGGVTDTFTVRLTRAPDALLAVTVASSAPQLGVASVSSLLFGPDNWSEPQAVTVTGTGNGPDGFSQVDYAIRLAVDPASLDTSGYRDLDPPDVVVTHLRREYALLVSAPSGSTTEAGGVATFTVQLSDAPTGEVAVSVLSSDATEGVASPTQLLFDASNWQTAQVVSVSGIDDQIADGAQPYVVTVSILASADLQYQGASPRSAGLVNADDDTAALLPSAASGPTTEAGGQATFTIRLTSEPTGSVLVDVVSADATEGVASPARLTFDAATWATPQTVTVTGVDDGAVDGAQPFTVGLTVAAASTDASGYRLLAPSTVPLTNQDDDTAGYVVSAASGPTTEAGGTATFTVRLSGQPNGLLVLDVASAVSAEGTAAPATLTFDAATWSTPQTVTVTGVDDLLADGDQPYAVVLSVSPASTDTTGLTAVDPPDVMLVNRDDDTRGILVGAASGPTTEGGGQATFTVRLASQPTGTVILRAASSNPAEGVATPAALTFTAASWAAPQAVTVTGVDDQVADGPRAYTVELALDAASTDGSGYGALVPGGVALTNLDDDVAALVVSAASGPTSEAGGQATFTVRLATQPVGAVALDVASTDATEGAAAPAQLTFTAATWATPQAVTVAGVDDADLDGPQAYGVRVAVAAATTDGTGYPALAPVTVALTNLDNDSPLYEVSAASGPTSEAGGQATFTVRLGAQPNGLLVVDVASAVPAEGTAAPASLTFDAASWATPQTVTVTGVDDLVDDGDQPYAVALSVSPASTDTSGIAAVDPPDVLLTNLDDDTRALLVSAASGPTSEAGGQATFTVRLATQPTGTVVLRAASASPAEGTAAPATLTFTPADWAAPQAVTVTGADDAVDDGDQAYQVRITPDAASTDGSGYPALPAVTVTLTNTDDDTAALLVSAASGPTTEAGGQATFTVRLASQPTGTVLVDTGTSDASEGAAAPARLTFTAATWSAPQTVTVTGADDFTVDGPQGYSIGLSVAAASTDASGYLALPAAAVGLVNQDDDVVALVVSAPSGDTTEAGGQATFTVRLATQPAGAVVLDVASADATEGLASPAALTFNATTWSTPQTVTVTGADDFAVDGPQAYAVVVAVNAGTADTTGYLALPPSQVALVNRDDDSLGWVVSAPSGATTEAGGQATFTVRPGVRPDGIVVVDVTSLSPAEGVASPATLTFDATDWATPQAVTVTGVDDLVADGDQPYAVALAISPSSLDTSGLTAVDPADVLLVNLDDDVHGYLVSAASGPTSEAGGQATFTVRLRSQPTGSVVLRVQSASAAEGAAAPASLTFDAATWATPRTVTVTGADDAVDDGDQPYQVTLTYDAASTDASGYAGLTPLAVDLTNLDDDTAGYLVGGVTDSTREIGSSATFTVRLTSAPAGTVLVDVTSADTTEGTVSPAQLSFTAADWSAPRTVTVTGVDDAVADGNVAYAVSLSLAAGSSGGGAYATLDPPDVALLNIDDDGGGGEGKIALFVEDHFRTVAIDGAVARVRGTPFQATSASSLFLAGYAEISRVPVGPQTVDVTFAGFGTVTLTGTVTAGGTASFGVASMMDPLPAGDLRVSLGWPAGASPGVYAFTPAGEVLSTANGSGAGTGISVEGTAGRYNYRLFGATQASGDYVFKTWDPSTGTAACAQGLVFRIYDSTGLVRTQPVPTAGCGAGAYGWNALRVNGGGVFPIDTFSSVEPTDGSY